ncbi:hypothetical protein KC344_g139 [Hortaea werneckii]|nr:hypothetical protein KC344_g139 [Hortaea werneckii]
MTPFAVLALLATSALSAPTQESPSIKVPLPERKLFQRATGDVDASSFMGHLNYTIQKYSGQALKSYNGGVADILKRQNAEEQLTDQVQQGEDELYYGPGTVGGQSGFTFDFDTGSSDTVSRSIVLLVDEEHPASDFYSLVCPWSQLWNGSGLLSTRT